LKKVKDLDEVLSQPNPDPRLKDVRDTLLEIAQSLAANTTTTSLAAVEIIRKSRI
jgi:hypothetical protein